MSLVPTAVRVMVILVAIASTAGQVAYLDALYWHKFGMTWMPERAVGSSTAVLLTAHAVVSVVCSLLAVALVLSEQHRQEASRALGVAFAAWSYLMAYSGATLLFRPSAPGLERQLFEAHFLVIETIGLVGLIRFTSIFPRSLPPEELRPSPTLPRVLGPVQRLAVLLLNPTPLIAAAALSIGALWAITLLTGGQVSDAGLSPLMDVIRLLAASLVVANLHRAWKASTEGDRDRLTWLVVALCALLAAVVFVIGGNVLLAVTEAPTPPFSWQALVLDAGLVGFLSGIAMSVLDRGGSDPAKIARLISTAATAAALCLFLAAALETLFTGGALASRSLRPGVGTAVSFAIVLATWRNLERFMRRVLPT